MTRAVSTAWVVSRKKTVCVCVWIVTQQQDLALDSLLTINLYKMLIRYHVDVVMAEDGEWNIVLLAECTKHKACVFKLNIHHALQV